MKILKPRNEAAQSDIQKTPISRLEFTHSLPENSIIHVACPNGSQYQSYKMTTDEFKEKVYESVQNTFKTTYWDTHERNGVSEPSDRHDVIEAGDNRPAGSSFADMVSYLEAKRAAPDEVEATDPNGFIDHLYYDFDVLKRYIVLKDGDLADSISSVSRRLVRLDAQFAKNMILTTTTLTNNREEIVSGESVNHGQTENDNYCQLEIKPGNRISDRTWTCPASGELVAYGWLDTSKCLNNKAVPSSFCVLEGKVNGSWEILAVESVTPAKSITYVGFTVPVRKNLEIRVRTGFDVGAKSGQFSNEQDGYDTLANSTPNGFKCMIYSNVSYTTTNNEN